MNGKCIITYIYKSYCTFFCIIIGDYYEKKFIKVKFILLAIIILASIITFIAYINSISIGD